MNGRWDRLIFTAIIYGKTEEEFGTDKFLKIHIYQAFG